MIIREIWTEKLKLIEQYTTLTWNRYMDIFSVFVWYFRYAGCIVRFVSRRRRHYRLVAYGLKDINQSFCDKRGFNNIADTYLSHMASCTFFSANSSSTCDTNIRLQFSIEKCPWTFLELLISSTKAAIGSVVSILISRCILDRKFACGNLALPFTLDLQFIFATFHVPCFEVLTYKTRNRYRLLFYKIYTFVSI